MHFPASLGRKQRLVAGVLGIGAGFGVPFLLSVAMVAAWQLWTVSNDDPKFPKPTTIIVEFRELWLFSQFGTHVVPSLERIGLGFGIAVLAGVALGIPLGLSGLARRAAMPSASSSGMDPCLMRSASVGPSTSSMISAWSSTP